MRTSGLVDLQVNGFAGVDFNDPGLDAAALDHALLAMLRTGVTTCLPTVITGTEPELAERLAALDRAVANSHIGPLMVPGFHLEGPFLNPAPGFAGCHPAHAMPPPDPAILRRITAGLRRPVLLLTLAPERDGAADLIAWARHGDMVVAIGHSAADAGQVADAARRGVTLSTHLGNALPQLLPKFLNPLMAQLAEDRLSASFIADGIHIPPAVLGVLMRAKGFARTLLVTDATAGAAGPPGLYRFAGMTIERSADGAVRVPETPRLAGSALCLDQAVRNVIAWGLAEPETALGLASLNPARLLGPALACREPPAAGIVTWSADLHPISVKIGECEFLSD